VILIHNLHEKTMSQADSFNTYYDVHKVAMEKGSLLGNKRVSKLYERKIKHFISKKIETLTELEIPLLAEK
jgi:hypothetical protein